MNYRCIIGCKGNTVDGTVFGEIYLQQIVAIEVKALDAIIFAVSHTEQIGLLIQSKRVRHIEMRGHLLILARPLSQVLAVLAELDDARVAVAVGDKEVAIAQHGNVSWLAQVPLVGAGHHAHAHLECRLACAPFGELEDLMATYVRDPGVSLAVEAYAVR